MENFEDMSLEFVQHDLEEYGMFHERDVLKDRVNTLESNLLSVSKAITDFVIPICDEENVTDEVTNGISEAVNFWDASLEEVEWFIRHARASVKWSGKEVLTKKYVHSFMKKDEYGLLKRLNPSESDKEAGAEYEMLSTVSKFAGVTQSLGWILLNHFMLDELEVNLDVHFYPKLRIMLYNSIGNKVEDFEALVKKYRLESFKRRYGV